jgi:pimeloyl-ACP methyl ester carboxylesterase
VVQRLVQTTIAPAPFDATACNLHIAAGATRDCVVLLVHGFGGHGYGTWRRVPEELFKKADVATFDFASWRRDPIGRTTRSEAWVDQLEAAVRDLATTYRHVFLVGHSLGGVIIEAVALRVLRDHREPSTELPIAGLIFACSPRAGTRLASFLPRIIVPDCLRPGSSHTRDANRYFSTNVDVWNVAITHPGKIVLPCYAVLATSDRIVSDLSAALRIPDDQRLRLAGSHKSVVKPPDHDNALVGWIQKCMDSRIEVRNQAERIRRDIARRTAVPDPMLPFVVTEFRTDASGSAWEEIYNAARRQNSTADVTFHDVRSFERETRVDLIVSVHDASPIAQGGGPARANVAAACQRGAEDPRLTIGVAPVGPDAVAAAAVVGTWLPAPTPRVYVEPAPGPKELLKVIAGWLRLVSERDPRRVRTDRSLDDAGTSFPEIGGYL